jgi:hypothetical protein
VRLANLCSSSGRNGSAVALRTEVPPLSWRLSILV